MNMHGLNRHFHTNCALDSLNNADRLPWEEGDKLGRRVGRVGRQHGNCEVAAHGHTTQPRAPTTHPTQITGS